MNLVTATLIALAISAVYIAIDQYQNHIMQSNQTTFKHSTEPPTMDSWVEHINSEGQE